MIFPFQGRPSPLDICCVGTQSFTYGDLARRAAIVTHALSHVAPGAISIATQSRFTFAAAFLGALNANRIVELPPNMESSTLGRLLGSGNVATILHDQQAKPGLCVTSLPQWSDPSGTDTLHVREFASSEEIVRLHTSGTTARPERIAKTAAQLFEEVFALDELFGSAATRVCSLVPAHHIYGLLFGILLPLARGGAFLSDAPLFPNAIEEALADHHVTMLIATPSILRSLTNITLPHALTIISSGSPLPTSIHRTLETNIGSSGKRPVVYDVLGSSETGGIAYRTSTEARFVPLPHVRVSQGDDMRLVVHSPWSPVECSDRARVFDDGTFEYLGRADAIVKIGGKRLDLNAMEIALRAIDGVDDCAVFAEPDAGRGSRIFAAIAGERRPTRAHVHQALADQFERAMLPRHYAFVSTLPRLPSGKLPRERLQSLFPSLSDEAARGPASNPLSDPATRELTFKKVDSGYEVVIPPNYVFFDGHFPGWPILPAVAQITEIALVGARLAYPDLAALTRTTRLKFRRTISPGARLSLTLKRVGNDVHFEIREGEALSTGGTLSFGPP